jgi:hypothetical protein
MASPPSPELTYVYYYRLSARRSLLTAAQKARRPDKKCGAQSDWMTPLANSSAPEALNHLALA